MRLLPGRAVPSKEVTIESSVLRERMTPGRGETVRKMASEVLHMHSLVTTMDRPMNVIDCLMSSGSVMYVCNAIS